VNSAAQDRSKKTTQKGMETSSPVISAPQLMFRNLAFSPLALAAAEKITLAHGPHNNGE
jgi:hypothetical protein